MIDGKLTFGLELECVKLTPDAVSLIQEYGFSRHFDASIRASDGTELPNSIEQGGGSEIVTPIYKVRVSMDSEGKAVKLDYGDAKNAVKAMCDCVAEINTSCGLHIHLGMPLKDNENKSVWKPEDVRTMLAICTMLEERLYGVVPPSRRNNRHCLPIKSRFKDVDLQSFYPVGQVMPRKSENPKRYCWLNLIETRRKGTDPRPNRQASEATGTIEVRMLGNTRRFEYIWAWTQLWIKIAAYVGYLQSSFAMMHCIVTDSLATEFQSVSAAKKNVVGPEGQAEANPLVAENEGPTVRPRQPIRHPRVPDVDNPLAREVAGEVQEAMDASPADVPVGPINIRRGSNRVERV